MGKRKSRAKPAPKKRMDKLDTVFNCPFCCNSKSVECRIDMKNSIAEAHCNDCKESYSTTATTLTEAVDVYSEWIDECERVNNLEDEDDLRSYKRGRQDLDNDDLEEEEDEDDVGPYNLPRREQEEDVDDLEDEDDVRQYKQPRRREFLQDDDDDDLARQEQVDDLEDEVEGEQYEYEEDDDIGMRKRPSGRQERVNDPEDEYEDEDEDDL